MYRLSKEEENNTDCCYNSCLYKNNRGRFKKIMDCLWVQLWLLLTFLRYFVLASGSGPVLSSASHWRRFELLCVFMIVNVDQERLWKGATWRGGWGPRVFSSLAELLISRRCRGKTVSMIAISYQCATVCNQSKVQYYLSSEFRNPMKTVGFDDKRALTILILAHITTQVLMGFSRNMKDCGGLHH